jgi:DNA-binding MarR family transcriptional regulator
LSLFETTDPEELRRQVLEEYAGLMRTIHFGAGARMVPWAGIDLTLPQLKVLGLLASRPEGMHGRELATALGVGPPAVTALVERLVEPGYARREEGSHDRRITWIRLTDRGRSLVERMASGQRERLGEILDKLGPEDLLSVQQVFQLLREAGQRLAADAGLDKPA